MSDGFWSILTIIGLIGWLGSAILFIFRSFPERGQFDPRPARLWGGLFALSYAVWVVGMLNA